VFRQKRRLTQASVASMRRVVHRQQSQSPAPRGWARAAAPARTDLALRNAARNATADPDATGTPATTLPRIGRRCGVRRLGNSVPAGRANL